MCGIAGALASPAAGAPDPLHVERMTARLVHRGPDAGGVWTDGAAVCLGSRRLAILDPSTAGDQPMTSPSGRFVVVLNGEIYNHRALRDRLADEARAPSWRGGSDTETLGAGFDAWGVAATIDATIGMFAIAVWDRERRTLTLVRDRIGEKPLYYAHNDGVWIFASEIKALAAHPAFTTRIDPQALGHYLALGYVPAPRSIWSGVAKLAAGSSVTLSTTDANAREQRYWSIDGDVEPRRTPFAHEADAVDALEALLGDAVAQQMVADRPVGALLSGGIDSTSIVALMCRHAATATSAIETFSIGFREHSFNEAHHAATVARHFGTHHTELYVGAADVLDTLPRLPEIYDEPFADVSQIPTWLVSRLAAGSVTVALTGDGGDELFGGYPRYVMGARLWPAVRRVPRPLRGVVGGLVGLAPPTSDRLFAWASPHDEASGVRGLRPAQKLRKLGRVIGSGDVAALYWRLLAPSSGVGLAAHRRAAAEFPDGTPHLAAATIEEDFMRRDLAGYLPDDILAKIDRASMAVSLESRAPLLDHRVIAFALGLPHAFKYRDGTSKWLLRQMLYRHIPRNLVDRPKMGFEIPIASWLRGALKPWAYDLVGSARGEAAEQLDLKAVRALLDRHASGVGDGHQPLWTALMYLNWAKQQERASAANESVFARPSGPPRVSAVCG